MIGSKGRAFSLIEDRLLKTQKIYRPEDTISEGVTLTAIYEDRVIVSRDGRKEVLLLDFDTFGSGADAGSIQKEAATPLPLPEGGPQDRKNKPSPLALDVRLLPHFSSGKRDGFTVLYVRQGSPLEAIGLQRKDLIVKINDIPAGDLRNTTEITRMYGDALALDLEVKRDHRTISMRYTPE
jgi:general secretion pathway protein C